MDWYHWAGFGAGAFVLIVAAISALKGPLGLNHVALFAIGAVLAGIPYVHLNGPGVSIDVGQLQQAATANTKAAASEDAAMASLDSRLNALTALVETLSRAQAESGSQGAGPVLGPGATASVETQLSNLQQAAATTKLHLQASRSFTAQAAMHLKIPAPESQPNP